MSYEIKKKEFGRQHVYIVELDLDYCSLTSGVGACASSYTGDAKCHNTLNSCFYTKTSAATSQYSAATKTYRFCESLAPHPAGIDAIPCLKTVSISAAKIDLKGGLGVRASVSLSFGDFPHSDIDVDKYVNDRTYIASDRGTFWTKLRARNPNYQFKGLRVLSGYLSIDGSYDAANFESRYYVVEKMDVSGGRATITGKDPLKLASKNKAQAPKPSTGSISADISASATSVTLIPAGVGNAEYPSSGRINIKSEVMSFTRSGDNLTLTRGQNNTVASEHSTDDTAQLCLEYSGKQVNFIVNDLLTNYANISSSFINTAEWQSEIADFIPGLLSGIIVKPFDVFKLLKELSQSSPHYLWWDEREQQIQLTALKSPPPNSTPLTMDDNILADSFSTVDKPEMRVSTIFVNFGQFDPTKKLDEPGNYQQSYTRVDTGSIAKFGSSEIEVINSRWISNFNKGAALKLATLIGRRFSNTPRHIKFSLDAKDSDVWAGQSRSINHRDVVDASGLPVNTVYQITSSRESKNFDYEALEFAYGDEVAGDVANDISVIYIPDGAQNVNLLTQYNLLFPANTSSTKALFIIQSGSVVGSSSTGTSSIITGSWTSGATVTLQVDAGGYAVGAGGNGGARGVNNGSSGGKCINLQHNLTIVNHGIIGGGGGGGGGAENTEFSTSMAGGGGAGNNIGVRGLGASDGTIVVGGDGEFKLGGSGGDGGDLGQAGSSGNSDYNGGGGASGVAIDKNGFTLTQTVAGDIRGAVTS